jgi:hypothetical protein
MCMYVCMYVDLGPGMLSSVMIISGNKVQDYIIHTFIAEVGVSIDLTVRFFGYKVSYSV